MSLTSAGYWRQSLDDGVYGIAGNLVRSGQDSKARFIGTQFELAVALQATAERNLTASVSAFEAGSFIKDTGLAQTIKMLGLIGKLEVLTTNRSSILRFQTQRRQSARAEASSAKPRIPINNTVAMSSE